MHLISIIVPIYKVEKYLCECIDSIISQTYKNIEIILVDDGSPDNCPAICDEYSDKDERIKVIHKENGGLSSARNAGLNIAMGEYICFVDSDDIIHPQYCDILLNAIQEDHCDFCACKFFRFNDSNLRWSSPVYSNNYNVQSVSWAEFLHLQIASNIDIGVCNRIFKRSLFNNLRFINGKHHEDIVFAADLFECSINKIAIIDLQLYYYRQHIDSFINSQQKNMSCHSDWIFATSYLIQKAILHDYKYTNECVCYAVKYPWSFVDTIFLKFSFKKNHKFLNEFQAFISQHRVLINNTNISKNIKHRMNVFSKSKLLYSVNVFVRLFRVYLYRILKLDPYKSGHGI